MARKSNKTAHVLNLLSGHDNQPAADETPDKKLSANAETESSDTAASEKSASAEAEVAAGAVPVQNISVIDTTGEDPVADLIQQNLSAQFEGSESDVSADVSGDEEISDKTADTVASAHTTVSDDAAYETVADDAAALDTADTYSMEAASDNVTVPTPEPVPAPAPVSFPTPDPVTSVPVPEPESVPGPGPTMTSKQEAEPASGQETEPEPDFVYVNMMESIVKDKIIYFMRQFDVCTCKRCVADTIALTMNGLTPRYIVTSPAAVDPLVSFYTNRLISDVTVEATKACMIVKDNPRH